MLRRSSTALLALGLVAVSAGCTTFSDNDAVARVGDTELSVDDFEAQLTDLGVGEQDVVSADAVRSTITTWIVEQLAAQPVDDEALAASYDAGVAESGVLCISAIVVDDEATAADVDAELESGTGFDELFAEWNLDQQLAATGGALPCITAADIEATEGVPFLDVAVGLDAEARHGTAPLLDQTGSEIAWVVVNFRPYDELTDEDRSALSTANVDADVHVDPRYGTFDRTTTQVVALG